MFCIGCGLGMAHYHALQFYCSSCNIRYDHDTQMWGAHDEDRYNRDFWYMRNNQWPTHYRCTSDGHVTFPDDPRMIWRKINMPKALEDIRNNVATVTYYCLDCHHKETLTWHEAHSREDLMVGGKLLKPEEQPAWQPIEIIFDAIIEQKLKECGFGTTYEVNLTKNTNLRDPDTIKDNDSVSEAIDKVASAFTYPTRR